MSLPLTVLQREIGKTGVKISAIGYGAMSLVSGATYTHQLSRTMPKS